MVILGEGSQQPTSMGGRWPFSCYHWAIWETCLANKTSFNFKFHFMHFSAWRFCWESCPLERTTVADEVASQVAHCCTILFGHLGNQLQARCHIATIFQYQARWHIAELYFNINIKEIIWQSTASQVALSTRYWTWSLWPAWFSFSGVYTNVFDHVDWLRQNIGQKSQDPPTTVPPILISRSSTFFPFAFHYLKFRWRHQCSCHNCQTLGCRGWNVSPATTSSASSPSSSAGRWEVDFFANPF